MDRLKPFICLGLLCGLFGIAPAFAQELWTAGNARTAVKLNPHIFADLGINVRQTNPRAVASKEGYLSFAASKTSRALFSAPGGDLEKLRSASFVHDGGFVLDIRDRTYSLERFELRFAGAPFRFDLLDVSGRRWFQVENAQFRFDPRLGVLRIINTDVMIAPEMAELLGHPGLTGQYVGTLDIELDATPPKGIDVAATTRAGECDEDNQSAKDVALISIGALSQLVREPGGRVAMAPSATLKNVGAGTVPWFRAIAPDGAVGQHPFLAMHFYRIAGGVIEQIGQGDIKHAFLTINTNCPCASGHLLYKNCEDVYGVSTNASRFQLAPRDEVTTSTGVWQSLGSHFDGIPVDDVRSHGGDGAHDAWEHRLVVREPNLQTTGGQYFIEAWYIVQDDINIFNGIGYREVSPTLVSGAWTFPFVTSLANGSTLDAWVDPVNPGVGNANGKIDSGEGHLQLAVRTSAVGGGTHYEYALMNLDFDRQISSFFVPLPAGISISNLGFGDVDTNASNDWQASVDINGITWSAPGGNTLDWGTLFNFRFDANAAPITGTATLGIFEAGSGSSLAAETQVPDGGSVGSGIPCGDVRSFTSSCKRKNGLEAKVNFRTSSHSGESVVIGVDGVAQFVTISGRKATLQISNPASGSHTLTLEDPAGCEAPVTVTCQ